MDLASWSSCSFFSVLDLYSSLHGRGTEVCFWASWAVCSSSPDPLVMYGLQCMVILYSSSTLLSFLPHVTSCSSRCWHCFGSVLPGLCMRRGAGSAPLFSEHYSQRQKRGKALPFPTSPWGFLCSCLQDNSIPKSYLFVLSGLFLSPYSTLALATFLFF